VNTRTFRHEKPKEKSKIIHISPIKPTNHKPKGYKFHKNSTFINIKTKIIKILQKSASVGNIYILYNKKIDFSDIIS